MESIEKLREWASCLCGYARLSEFIDEIEAEITERFMELPVDADGVPIHYGDTLEHHSEPCATCAKHDTCFYSSERVIDCIRHEPKLETNYERLFGTPERAAETLAVNCYGAPSDACDTCVHTDCDGTLRNRPVFSAVYDALLEWLGGGNE